jgi:pyruvate carboxylase
MIRAIDDYRINGVATTLSFCRFVLEHPAFVSGKFDTHFVKSYFTPEVLNDYDETEAGIAALIASRLLESGNNQSVAAYETPVDKRSSWKKNRLS